MPMTLTIVAASPDVKPVRRGAKCDPLWVSTPGTAIALIGCGLGEGPSSRKWGGGPLVSEDLDGAARHPLVGMG